MIDFWTGAPEVGWLYHYPGKWCVSSHRIRRRTGPLRPAHPDVEAVLDSGAFSEIAKQGRWTVSPEQYVEEVCRWTEQLGPSVFRWVAIQDWMCEPEMVTRTGLSVEEHQARTVQSFMDLQALAPDVPWLPVLQGHTPDEYWNCARLYEQAGVRLREQPVVGLGSVCRRQTTAPVHALIHELAGAGIKLHGFGVKTAGLPELQHGLVSADSMAWSMRARMGRIKLDGCTHATCANCPAWAKQWGDHIVSTLQEHNPRTHQDLADPSPGYARYLQAVQAGASTPAAIRVQARITERVRINAQRYHQARGNVRWAEGTGWTAAEPEPTRTCPRCGTTGPVSDLFGWRTCAGRQRPQSYCRPCRGARKP